MPKFRQRYQSWYSESLVIIKLLLPDRLDDFIRQYQKPKSRKTINYENYVIDDYLNKLILIRGKQEEKIVGLDAAISKFEQQLNIIKSAERKFESSLFNIRSIVQADLFNSEIEAAHELNKKGYTRAAGAIAGVVLEHHLLQVCQNHCVEIPKKNPTINDYNELLKSKEIIEIHDWRFIQRLGDLRNLCDHKKNTEPEKNQVEELIEGVDKVTKTIF